MIEPTAWEAICDICKKTCAKEFTRVQQAIDYLQNSGWEVDEYGEADFVGCVCPDCK